MKKLLICSVCLLAFCGAGASYADNSEFKASVVDVGQVLNASLEMRNLEKEHREQVDKLIIFINDSSKEIAATSDEVKKQELRDKFKKELVEKKEKIDKDYYKKLSNIDKNLSKTVEEMAKEDNLNLIISNDAVLYSKNDMTASLVKKVSSKKNH